MVLLRELYDKIKNGEDVQEADYTRVGLKNKARLKDIEKEISNNKRKVSRSIKLEMAQQEEIELMEVAKRENLTIEELKEQLAEKERNSDFSCNDRALRHKENSKKIAEARNNKTKQYGAAIGEYDLYVEYV
ncbi:unnamed protein product [Phytomonas sp. EM1]|nr:unnamed protein product [Phytomonas sp. EM1]|eukprot:CCW64613.1 unnamed protein product [Phytomonas sp. isolate EM1]